MQFVWIKHLRCIKYAFAHAHCLRPKVEADDRKFRAMKESFDKTTDMYMAIRRLGYPLSTQNTGMYNYIMNIYFYTKPR